MVFDNFKHFQKTLKMTNNCGLWPMGLPYYFFSHNLEIWMNPLYELHPSLLDTILLGSFFFNNKLYVKYVCVPIT